MNTAYQPPTRPAGYRQSAVGAWLDSLDAQEASEREPITAETVFTITGDSVPPF